MIKNLFESKGLNESSASRLAMKFEKYETAIITAYRGEFSKAENQARNRELYSALSRAGYSVTSVKGSWMETDESGMQREVGEHSFVVSNMFDKPAFFLTIFKLAMYFDQDAVLIFRGGECYLVGTTKRPGAYPGFGKTVHFSRMRVNPKAAEFFTRLGNSRFVFEAKTKQEKAKLCEYYVSGMSGKLMEAMQGDKILEEANKIELPEELVKSFQ